MSGRPRTTSFAEGNKQPTNPVVGMKVSSKYWFAFIFFSLIFFPILESILTKQIRRNSYIKSKMERFSLYLSLSSIASTKTLDTHFRITVSIVVVVHIFSFSLAHSFKQNNNCHQIHLALAQIDFESYPIKTISQNGEAPACEQNCQNNWNKVAIRSLQILPLFICMARCARQSLHVIRIRSCTFYFRCFFLLFVVFSIFVLLKNVHS